MRNIRKFCLLLAIAFLFTGLQGCRKSANDTGTNASTYTTEQLQKRETREGIQTILILCLAEYDLSGDSSGYRNASRADFMQLLVVDALQKKITPIQLNPDTMVPFTVAGVAQQETIPMGLVFSYGSGGSDSCLNVTNAVSELFGGLKIDYYLTFTIDSVAVVNDMVGGVTVPTSADSSEDSMLLSGTDAVKFFSFRNAEDIANEFHMEQQQQYMKALYHPFIASAQNEDFLTKLALQLGEKMTTNLTLSQLVLMFETFGAYNMEEEIITFPGDAQKIDSMYQFYIDEASVEDVLEELIYE